MMVPNILLLLHPVLRLQELIIGSLKLEREHILSVRTAGDSPLLQLHCNTLRSFLQNDVACTL